MAINNSRLTSADRIQKHAPNLILAPSTLNLLAT